MTTVTRTACGTPAGTPGARELPTQRQLAGQRLNPTGSCALVAQLTPGRRSPCKGLPKRWAHLVAQATSRTCRPVGHRVRSFLRATCHRQYSPISPAR